MDRTTIQIHYYKLISNQCNLIFNLGFGLLAIYDIFKSVAFLQTGVVHPECLFFVHLGMLEFSNRFQN